MDMSIFVIFIVFCGCHLNTSVMLRKPRPNVQVSSRPRMTYSARNVAVVIAGEKTGTQLVIRSLTSCVPVFLRLKANC